MKRFLPLFVVVVIAGAAAFGVTQWICHKGCPDDITWLKTEFKLSDEQIAAIKKIRADYGPECAHHCSKISSAREKLSEARKTHGPGSPAFAAAERELAAITEECAKASHGHLAAIAAQMPPEQGRRYLEMVGPKLIDTSPAATPAVSK